MSIKSIDKENLEKIRFMIQSSHKITKEKTKHGTWIYRFSIYSNEIVRDLQELEKKKERFIINPNFMRGLIDGDGSIQIGNGLKVYLFSNDRKFLEKIIEIWEGKIYKHGNKNLALYWNKIQSEKLLQTIYGSEMPFLCIARKYSRWQLYQAEVSTKNANFTKKIRCLIS